MFRNICVNNTLSQNQTKCNEGFCIKFDSDIDKLQLILHIHFPKNNKIDKFTWKIIRGHSKNKLSKTSDKREKWRKDKRKQLERKINMMQYELKYMFGMMLCLSWSTFDTRVFAHASTNPMISLISWRLFDMFDLESAFNNQIPTRCW